MPVHTDSSDSTAKEISSPAVKRQSFAQRIESFLDYVMWLGIWGALRLPFSTIYTHFITKSSKTAVENVYDSPAGKTENAKHSSSPHTLNEVNKPEQPDKLVALPTPLVRNTKDSQLQP